MKSMRGLPRLQGTFDDLAKGFELPEAAREEARKRTNSRSTKSTDIRIFVGGVGNIFRGLSLGSVLILMALGLAHYIRSDGRHQHGARRVNDDWRLRHF